MQQPVQPVATTSSTAENADLQRMKSLYEQSSRALKREVDTNNKLRRAKEQLQQQVDSLTSELLAVRHLSDSTGENAKREKALRMELADAERRIAQFTKDSQQHNAVMKRMKEQMGKMSELLERIQSKHAAELAAQRDQLVQQNGQAEGSEQIASLQRQVEQLRVENSALREELSAFDVQFFDEIEELKYRHADACKQLANAEQVIQKLRQQLAAVGE